MQRTSWLIPSLLVLALTWGQAQAQVSSTANRNLERILLTGPGDALGKQEDSAHGSGDAGVMSLGVRNDTHTNALSGTNGDYTPLGLDSTGKLGIRGTYVEDSGHTSGDLGLLHLCVRNDAGTALAGTDLDYIPCATDTTGAFWTRDRSSLVDDGAFTPGTSLVQGTGAMFDDVAPDSVDEGDIGIVRMSANRNMYITLRDAAGNERGLNVDANGEIGISAIRTSVTPGTAAANLGKAEDAAHSSGDVGVMGLGVRNDTRGTLAGTDLDYAPLQLNSSGDLRADIASLGGSVTTTGSGVVGTGTLRVTQATDVRVGVDPISGQTGIAGGTGVDGATVPRVTLATNVALPAGTNILGALSANQSVNVAQINSVTPLMGAGVTGTGSPRVSLATDANTIQISQTTPATTNGMTPVPTSNAAAANALTSSGAVQASNVLKASAGNLYSLTITTGATAGFLMIFNLTSAPIDGAVTPAYCSQAPANMTSAIEWSIPVRFATGITAVFSSTGCFTKTESATAAFFAQVN